MKLQRYAEFSPSGWDSPSNYIGDDLHDRKDWWVGLTRNRDSCDLEESNFHAALKMLGGEGEFVEVHRFGHWACGWYEIVLVSDYSFSRWERFLNWLYRRERQSKAEILADIANLMADYPCLDEEDYSNREHETASGYWEDMSTDDRIDHLCENNGYTPREASVLALKSYGDLEDDSGNIQEALLYA